MSRCVEGIENMRTSPEAIAGYSGALAAVLGGVRLSPLGVPHTKGKVLSKQMSLKIYFICSSMPNACSCCHLRNLNCHTYLTRELLPCRCKWIQYHSVYVGVLQRIVFFICR